MIDPLPLPVTNEVLNRIPRLRTLIHDWDPMRYRKGYKYQLAAQEIIAAPELKNLRYDSDFLTLRPEGVLTIRKGYAWDGPSGPTFDTRTFMLPSLAHDAGYQMCRQIVDDSRSKWRKQCDLMLYRLCLECGMWKIRAKWVLWGVRRGGASSASAAARKTVHTA